MNPTTNFDSVLNAQHEAPDRMTGQSDSGASIRERRVQCYETIEATVRNVVSDIQKMRVFLDVQSRFERYSLNNNLLIYAQRPDATRIRDKDAWEKDGLCVRKDAVGFQILEPHPYTTPTGEKRNGYNPKEMYDISDLYEAPTVASPSYDQKLLIRALINKSPAPIKTVAEYPANQPEGAYYSVRENCIYAKQGMGFVGVFEAVAQAMAHAEIARGEEDYRPQEHLFQARCVAYVLAKKYGVPSERLRIDSVPVKYENAEYSEIKQDLAEIHDSVREIAGRMSEILERPGREKQQTERRKR